MHCLKKFLSVLSAVIAIFYLASPVEAAKKTVMIVPLKNISNYHSMNVEQIMTEKLTIALQNSGKYSVIERDQINEILREQGFQNLTADPNSAVKVGKLVGANYSVFGQVTFANVSKNAYSRILPKSAAKGVINGWGAKVEINIRFVNNETGELVFAEDFVGTKTGINETDALHSACKEAAEVFFDKIMSTSVGKVIDLQGSNIYIDQGLDSGFRKGDTLIVLRETSPIVSDGQIVGMKTIQIGKIKIDEVNAGYSICKIVSIKSGYVFKKGDIIKRG